MKIYYNSKRTGLNATADYNMLTGEVVVKKGSLVSEKISNSPTFRSANSIAKKRKMYCKDRVVIKDVTFNSLSCAANFIIGSSSNGYKVWKDSKGRYLSQNNS